METFSPSTFFMLDLTSLVAGFIDAIAGGGGLLTLPALALAGLDPLSALATNKLQSSFGSGSATLAFKRNGHIDFRRLWPLALASAAGSLGGSILATFVSTDSLKALLPFVLIAVALYFLLSPNPGQIDRHPLLSLNTFGYTVVPLIGYYDGFFGPGTGSFFMMGFVALCGLGFLQATGLTKLCNFASNLASLLVFSLGGHVLWGLGLSMGLGQILGAYLGAHFAMAGSKKLIRPALVILCIVLAVKLGGSHTLVQHILG